MLGILHINEVASHDEDGGYTLTIHHAHWPKLYLMTTKTMTIHYPKHHMHDPITLG